MKDGNKVHFLKQISVHDIVHTFILRVSGYTFSAHVMDICGSVGREIMGSDDEVNAIILANQTREH